jgi:hypothetical protein
MIMVMTLPGVVFGVCQSMMAVLPSKRRCQQAKGLTRNQLFKHRVRAPFFDLCMSAVVRGHDAMYG